jgi:UDP-N-acetylmuramate dehydrogenase
VQKAREILSESLGSSLKLIEPLDRYTTFGVGGAADFFSEAKTIHDLIRSVEAAQQARVPLFILGAGSSVIFSDVGFHGLVIRNEAESIQEIATEVAAKVGLLIASGTSLAKLVRFAVEKSYTGMESLAGLPGTVGGAVVANSGSSGVSISESIESVRIIDATGKTRTLTRGDCNFSSGSSRFSGRGEVILEVRFNLIRSAPSEVAQKISALMQLQMSESKEPRSIPIFNPVEGEDPGRLIEAIGLAGHQIGGVEVSASHPNFMKNLGHATSENVAEMLAFLKRRVKEKYYYELKEDFLVVDPH